MTSRFLIIAAITGFGLLATPNARAVNTLPSVNAPSGAGSVTFTFGTYTVQIFSCNETSGGTTIAGDCSNEQVIGTVTSNGSLVLTYQSAGGGSLLNTTVGGANKDMALSETISTTGKLINGVSLGLTGSLQTPSNAFEQQDVKTSEVDNTTGQVINLNTNMGNGASPFTVAQSISTAASLVSISKDMAVGSGGGVAGDAVALNSVTQIFNVPEPASLSLLAMGLGGLLGVRRWRARTASEQSPPVVRTP